MEKMTKMEMFAQILNHLTDDAEIAFIQHEMDLLAKKNASRSNKPTKAQAENVALAECLLNRMETGKAYRVSELFEAVPELSGKSSQKVVGILRTLMRTDAVKRSEVKGIAYFTKC